MKMFETLFNFLVENRAEYIANKQGNALMNAYHNDRGAGKPKGLKTPEEVVKHLSAGDPSKQQENLQWLANRYAENDFSLEDMPRVKKDIENFYHVRNYLKDKNLLQYDYNRLDKEVNPITTHLPALKKHYDKEVKGYQSGQVRMAPSQAKFKDVKEILKELSKADPTPDKRFMVWIVNQYKDGKLSIGNLNGIKTQLETLANSPALKDKDLSSMSPQEVYSLITKHGDRKPLNWKPSKEVQTMMNKGDITKVFQDDQVAVLIPHTHAAACVLGEDTNWCTASRSDSMYKTYSKQGPLYVIFTPEGKFQFHFESNQHMNKDDRPAELGLMIERYPQIADVFKELAEKHGTLGLLKNPSQKALVAAVTNKPEKIKEIGPSKLTKEVVNAAVANATEYNMKDIFGYAMKHRPDLVDDATKLAVITAIPKSISDIAPKELKPEQVEAAMKSKNSTGAVDAFRYVEQHRPELITDKIREEVLKKDGRILKEIGKKATPGMVKSALSDSQDAHALEALEFAMKNMPSKVEDEDILELVKRSRFALQHVPADRQSEEIVKTAIQADPGAFAFVANPSDEALETAMMSGPFLLKHMAKHHNRLTTDMFKKMAAASGRKLIGELQMFDAAKHIPSHIDLDQVYEAALTTHPEALQMIPPKKQKVRWIKAAVKSNPKAIKFANKELIEKDPELKKLAKA